jgi:hypothetical protein
MRVFVSSHFRCIFAVAVTENYPEEVSYDEINVEEMQR